MTAAVIAISVIAFIILLIVLLLTAYVKIELEYDSEPFVKVKYLLFSRILMPETKQSIRRKKRKEKKEKKKQEKAEKKRRKELRGQHLNSEKKSAKNPEKKAAKNSDNIKSSQKAAPPQKAQQVSKGDGAKNAQTEKKSDKRTNVKTADKAIPKKGKPKPDLNMIINCVKAAKPHVKKLFKKIRIYDVFAEIVVGGTDAANTALSYGVHCAAINGFIAFLKNNVSFTAKKIDIKADFELEKTDYYIYGKVKVRLSTLLSCLIWGYSAVQGAMNNDTPQGQPQSKGTAKKAA